MSVTCFLIIPTDTVRLWFRRYASESKCTLQGEGRMSYHNEETFWQDVPLIRDGRGYDETHCVYQEKVKNDNPLWPYRCKCDYIFTEGDARQIHSHRLYRRADNNELTTINDAEPGAMWDADWLHDIPSRVGPDGKSLHVVCPGGHHWNIDGPCSNCTKPNDKVHKCWVRHGEAPALTVDKNGVTCSAGAGSIQTPNWHGFLRNGVLA